MTEINENQTHKGRPLTLMPRAPKADTSGRRNLFDFSPDGLVEEMRGQGLPVFRPNQILHWIYVDLVTDFQAMTNLPMDLRRKLAERYRIGSAELVAQQVSAEG